MPEESTTPELLELVRRLVEALDRRDFDAAASLLAPDVFYRGAEIGTFEGQAAVRGLLEDMPKPGRSYTLRPRRSSTSASGPRFSCTSSGGVQPAASRRSDSVLRASSFGAGA